MNSKLVPLVLLLLVCPIIYTCQIKGPNSDNSKLNEIERMWQMLPMYPGMIEGNVHRTSRGNQALLGKEYKSSVNYETLKSFYTENLTQSGWKFLREKQVKDWGRDLGGRELEFQKGEYILDIQYSGEKANYGWQYTIDIDWDASRAPL